MESKNFCWFRHRGNESVCGDDYLLLGYVVLHIK